MSAGQTTLSAPPRARGTASLLVDTAGRLHTKKNLMDEPNRHFRHSWAWEDGLAQAVQSL